MTTLYIRSKGWTADDLLDFICYIEPYFEDDLGIPICIDTDAESPEFGVEDEGNPKLALEASLKIDDLFQAWMSEDYSTYPVRDVEAERKAKREWSEIHEGEALS